MRIIEHEKGKKKCVSLKLEDIQKINIKYITINVTLMSSCLFICWPIFLLPNIISFLSYDRNLLINLLNIISFFLLKAFTIFFKGIK